MSVMKEIKILEKAYRKDFNKPMPAHLIEWHKKEIIKGELAEILDSPLLERVLEIINQY